jgi:hypothetical protein
MSQTDINNTVETVFNLRKSEELRSKEVELKIVNGLEFVNLEKYGLNEEPLTDETINKIKGINKSVLVCKVDRNKDNINRPKFKIFLNSFKKNKIASFINDLKYKILGFTWKNDIYFPSNIKNRMKRLANISK